MMGIFFIPPRWLCSRQCLWAFQELHSLMDCSFSPSQPFLSEIGYFYFKTLWVWWHRHLNRALSETRLGCTVNKLQQIATWKTNKIRTIHNFNVQRHLFLLTSVIYPFCLLATYFVFVGFFFQVDSRGWCWDSPRIWHHSPCRSRIW